MSKEKTKGKHVQPKKKVQFSKVFSLLVTVFGFIIAQECLYLMYLCIQGQYLSTASWITAGVALAQAVILGGLSCYTGVTKIDHQQGGITYDAAANGWNETDTMP